MTRCTMNMSPIPMVSFSYGMGDFLNLQMPPQYLCNYNFTKYYLTEMTT